MQELHIQKITSKTKLNVEISLSFIHDGNLTKYMKYPTQWNIKGVIRNETKARKLKNVDFFCEYGICIQLSLVFFCCCDIAAADTSLAMPIKFPGMIGIELNRVSLSTLSTLPPMPTATEDVVVE